MHRRKTVTVVPTCILIAVLALGGCAPREDGGATTTDSIASTAAAMTPPPKLPVSWKEMEPADWHRHVTESGVTFPPGDAYVAPTRACRDGRESDRCQLKIIPVANVERVSQRALSERGEILAAIMNIGEEDEKTLGLPAAAFAYWVAFLGTDGKAHSVLVDPTKKGVIFGKEWGFGTCEGTEHHKHVLPPGKAMFSTCDHVHTQDPTALERAHLHTSPPWISCVEGCCFADGTR